MSNKIGSKTALLLWPIFLIFFVSISQTSFANSTEQNFMVWTSYQKNGQFSNQKLKYLLQLDARFINKENAFEQGVARAGLGYALTNAFSLWMGYDFVPSMKDNRNKLNYEQRIWQQILWKMTAQDKFQLASRTRLEQRHNFQRSGIALRLRQRFLLKLTDAIHDAISPVIYDEIMFNLNHPSWVGNKAIDQNRLFLGADFSLSKDYVLRIGYLNQLKFRKPINIVNHSLYLSLSMD